MLKQGKIIKYLLLFFILLFITPLANAEQKYNVFEDKWETVPKSWKIKYNPMKGDFSYQPKEAKIEYNQYESTWDWDSGNNYSNNESNEIEIEEEI